MLGMQFIELSLNELAGRAFKNFIRRHTAHPISAILTGVIITALLQSSSIVSLMVLAFVGAGIIELRNALGIIIGSNLGTTFTGWIVAYFGFSFQIESFAFVLIAGGAVTMTFFAHRERIFETGKLLTGFGFLFLGLEFMKSSIEEFALHVDIAPYVGGSYAVMFVVGFVLTAIIQSSTAAMVITLSALSSQMITLEAAAAMAIGNDLGTTIKVIFGGLKGSPAKKRVAVSHFLFNLVIDVVALVFLVPLLSGVRWAVGDQNPLITLVAFHSTINLLGILLFLPFLKTFARLLERLFKTDDSIVARFIINIPDDVPEMAVEGLRKEVRHLLERVFWYHLTLLEINNSAVFKDKKPTYLKDKAVAKQYEEMKELEGEIVEYSVKVQAHKLPASDITVLQQLFEAVRHSMATAKAIKDIAHNIREFQKSSNDNKLALFELMKKQQLELHEHLYGLFESESTLSNFEVLLDLKNESKEHYNRFIETAAPMIRENRFTDVEISTLFNVNRELHHANKSLINALKDLLLNAEQAAYFERAG